MTRNCLLYTSKTFRAQAEKQVKIRLALEKIVELEKLEASKEEIDAEYAKMAEAYKMDVDKVKGCLLYTSTVRS